MAIPKIKVKLLAQEGDNAMVEFVRDGDMHRVSLPASEIENGEASLKSLNTGIEYGIDWDEIYPGLNNLNWEMHRRQIWTFQDARADITNLRKAVIAATNKIVTSIIEGGPNQ